MNTVRSATALAIIEPLESRIAPAVLGLSGSVTLVCSRLWSNK